MSPSYASAMPLSFSQWILALSMSDGDSLIPVANCVTSRSKCSRASSRDCCFAPMMWRVNCSFASRSNCSTNSRGKGMLPLAVGGIGFGLETVVINLLAKSSPLIMIDDMSMCRSDATSITSCRKLSHFGASSSRAISTLSRNAIRSFHFASALVANTIRSPFCCCPECASDHTNV